MEAQNPSQMMVNSANIHQMQQMQQSQQVEQQGQQQQPQSSQPMEVQQQQVVVSSPQQGQQQMLLVNTSGAPQSMQGMSTQQSQLCSAGGTISTLQQGSISHPVASPAQTGQTQLQQVSDWSGRQVQVLQQPVQNTYVQQVAYATAGANGPMLMSGNIQLHPGQNLNPGSIQVIAAGKPFQSNQLASHVLGKPVLTNQQGSFPSYATIPTTNNQTLVISQLGVISSQPNILPAHSAANQQHKQELQKIKPMQGVSGAQIKQTGQGGTVQSSMALSGCVVSQPTTMLHHLISPIPYTTCPNRGIQSNNGVQLSPWQFGTQLPQVWTQHPQQVITAQNPIFIRGPHQDQPMFIQSPPPQQAQPQQQAQTVGVAKPELKPQSPQVSRTLSILPSMTTTPIRAANSAVVSSVQTVQKLTSKTVRTKSVVMKAAPIQKLDAQNQTKPISPQPNSQHQTGPKMIITSQGTLMAQPQLLPQPQPIQAQVTLQHAQLQHQMLQPKPPPLMSIAMAPPTIQIPPKDAPILEEKMEVAPAPTPPLPQPETPAPTEMKPPEAPVEAAAPVEVQTPAPESAQETPKPTGPPKAMVKPQVLTHVIEGYVVKESSEPFPIYRTSLVSELAQTVKNRKDAQDEAKAIDADEPPLKKQNMEPTKGSGAAVTAGTPAGKKPKCEHCGALVPKDKVKKGKKFCSLSCTKKAAASIKKKNGAVVAEKDNLKKKDWDGTEDSASSPGSIGASDVNSGDSAADHDALKDLPTTNPVKWTVSDVCEFIKKLPPGCCDYVEDFAIQEIDGQALLLLKADHLMSAMSMKLGPALKICDNIETLRVAAEAAGASADEPSNDSK